MSEPVQVKVPFENVNDPTAKIVEWKFSSGSRVKAGQEVVELETTNNFSGSGAGGGVSGILFAAG